MKRAIDIFVRRPVLSMVISLLIFVLGLRSIGELPIQQYPTIESAIVSISTTFTGADPSTIAAFISTPLENAIAQANGIDYMTANSIQNTNTIIANLLLNYDADKALTEINTQVNSVVNQLPQGTLVPSVSVSIAQSIDSMYIGFYSKDLPSNKVTDYVLRVAQPKLQAVVGVQQAQILGGRLIAVRAWLDPVKLAGYHISPAEVRQVLGANNFVAPAGRTDGQTYTLNLTASTALTNVDQFRNMVIRADNNTIIRLKDVARVTLGAQNYDMNVKFDGKTAVYIGIVTAPDANLLEVISNVKKVFADIQNQLPQGIDANIVYDASEFVDSSIKEVIQSLLEAFLIVTVVVFIFLASIRSLIIPVIAIPLSVIGTFFVMYLLGYSINLLTLLALVLAIGLVVDDAIIVVENVHRHIDDGVSPFEAAILSVRELTKPIVAITVVLVAVYLPIGFMTGLTGALFTEFAFTLAGAVTVSAVIALTLSPMMCSRMLKPLQAKGKQRLMHFIDRQFDRLRRGYENRLKGVLNYLPVVVVFAAIILFSNYFLFVSSQSELAPQEDQGIILAQLTAAANASIYQTNVYSNQVNNVFTSYPETQHTFQIDGTSGSNSAATLNSSIDGMVLVPWDKRKLTSNQLQPQVQRKFSGIAGAKLAAFQPPSLPGGGSGLPIQFVVKTASDFYTLNTLSHEIIQKAFTTGAFLYIDPDLKIDKLQTTIQLNRDKISEFGLNMQDLGNTLAAALSEAYVNYFNYMGRSYQVIPQMIRQDRLNASDILNYYINTAGGKSILLSTVASLKNEVVPEAVNHFQQLNSVTISAIAAPGITMGKALGIFQNIAKQVLPKGYTVDYAGQSRQYMQESTALIVTFFFALIIIFLSLAVLFNSFRDPLIVLISVPLSICGAMIFISLGIGGATLNIYTEVGLVTLIGLISKHGILIVQFANDLQLEGKSKREAVETAAGVRFRPILMTTAAMVFGVVPLIMASGAGAVSRFDIGLVIATGISIGTLFTLFVVPSMYLLLAVDHSKRKELSEEVSS